MKTQIMTLLTAAALTTGLAASEFRMPRDQVSQTSSRHTVTSLERLSQAGEFSMFAAALQATGVDKTLRSGTFTILAPTNGAFATIPQSTMDMLMFEENKDLLRKMVLYHIVPGIVSSNNLRNSKSLRALMERRSLGAAQGNWKIPTAKILSSDIRTSDGMIHAINTVLIPQQPFANN